MRTDTLYVTDLDGTLLNADAVVSPESKAVISRLNRLGVNFTVATARTPATVNELLAGLDMRLGAIVMTGAAMWDMHRRVMTECSVLPRDVAAGIAGAFARHGVNPFVYNLGDGDVVLEVFHSARLTDAERMFYEPRRNLALKRFNIGIGAPDDGSTVLMFGIGDSGCIGSLADELRARGDCAVSSYPDNYEPSVSVIEVQSSGVSKAAAVSRLATGLGVKRVVVFGDNLNDLSMMAVADESVAVANAHPQVLAAADRCIGPNTDDSVARFIEAD